MGGDEAEAGPNADQAAFWNDRGGQIWVALQERLDAAMAPIAERLVQLAAPAGGEAAIDVGCGAGATTLALGRAVGPSGRVLGLDISAPLVERARTRVPPEMAGRVVFRVGDAQTEGFEPGGADLMVSRFGVMFFADPVAAFRNLAAALRPGGRAVFATWAALEENPWFLIARDAAEARLGRGAPPVPGAPGPFALSDAGMMLGLLEAAGFDAGAVRTERIALRQAATLQEAGELAVRMGPASRLLIDLNGSAEDAAAIREAVVERLEGYAGPDGVVVPALVHFFSAMRPSATVG